nr:hypothetical protein PIFADJLK_00048 [Oryctes rhinoceros nudivirus]
MMNVFEHDRPSSLNHETVISLEFPVYSFNSEPLMELIATFARNSGRSLSRSAQLILLNNSSVLVTRPL